MALGSLLRRAADVTRAALELRVQPPPQSELVLVDFRAADGGGGWRTTSDAVYGGASAAHLTPSDGARRPRCFHGELSTRAPQSRDHKELRTGYAAMLLREQFDLEDFDTLVLRCRALPPMSPRAPQRSDEGGGVTGKFATDDDANGSVDAAASERMRRDSAAHSVRARDAAAGRDAPSAPASPQRCFFFNVTTDSYVEERALHQLPFVAPEGAFGEVPLPFANFVMTSRGNVVEVSSELNKHRVLALGITLADGKDGPFALELDHLRAVRRA